nr:hypothetical protein [Allomuricauda sp.]
MAELLSFLNLIFDSGTLVLIWLVQLVIYPSFRYYETDDLKIWHKVYTKNVTFVVLPLMLGQLLLGIVSVYHKLDTFSIVRLLVILFLWAHTFLVFVPLHGKIESEPQIESVVSKLNTKNWTRTVFWTVLFLTNFLD